jgi:hypothetical protein
MSGCLFNMARMEDAEILIAMGTAREFSSEKSSYKFPSASVGYPEATDGFLEVLKVYNLFLEGESLGFSKRKRLPSNNK